ncbi:hypothetical protein, partial [Micromonospora saelicesensis]|uniref:hypothetical protein n=1 Tax=Micromonospora saelicesensis TaxID=285676 RepID=UPI001C6586A2
MTATVTVTVTVTSLLSLQEQAASPRDRLGFLETGASHRPRHRDFLKAESITGVAAVPHGEARRTG